MDKEVTFVAIMFVPIETGWVFRASYRLSNGVENTTTWELDADDQEILKSLDEHYGPKVLEKAAGQGQSFEPTGNVLGFEKDRQ